MAESSPRFVLAEGVVPIADMEGQVFHPHAGWRRDDIVNQKYAYCYTISCSAHLLEDLFFELAQVCLPVMAYAIVETVGPTRKTYLGQFQDKAILFDAIRPYMPQFVHDGCVAFGVAWYDPVRHEEVFVDDHKVVTVLTADWEPVEDVLRAMDIPHDPGVELMSAHPHTSVNVGGDFALDVVDALNLEPQ